MYGKYLQALKQAVFNCNTGFDRDEALKNAEEYGRVSAYSTICEDFGHSVDGHVQQNDKGLRRINYMMVDGQRLFENEIAPKDVVRFTTENEEEKGGNENG